MNIWQRIGRFLGIGNTRSDEIHPDSQDAKRLKEAPSSGDVAQKVRPIGRVPVSNDVEAPEFDLAEVNTIYTVDSYARQAVSRYIEFMFKQGWDFVSENPKANAYIRTRFAAIADATGIPTDQLFIEIAEDLVKYHNAFVVKARDDNFKWPKGIKVRGIYGRRPVVGYFVMDPTTFSVKRDRNGAIQYWEQQYEGADKPTRLRPEDVVHIAYQKIRGQVFGHPFLLTAREDILALRQLEDLVLRMVYRNIFPFIHYRVGTPEQPATDNEIDQAWAYIESAKTEGGLVTSERHEIKAVALDKVIDIEPHLRYFESRVFTAVGVPEVLMGRGQGASRATSDNLHVEFIDRVKAYQRVMESYINHFMIRELLLEGGFDPLLNSKDDVRFRFREIDFDAQIKRENHIIFKYEHNAITEDEMRNDLGLNPITDRSKMFLNLVAIPAARAKAKVASTDDTDNRVEPKNQNTQSIEEPVEDNPSEDNISVKERIVERAAILGEHSGLSQEEIALLEEALAAAIHEGVVDGGIQDQQHESVQS